jgi:hypothetical protein
MPRRFVPQTPESDADPHGLEISLRTNGIAAVVRMLPDRPNPTWSR